MEEDDDEGDIKISGTADDDTTTDDNEIGDEAEEEEEEMQAEEDAETATSSENGNDDNNDSGAVDAASEPEAMEVESLDAGQSHRGENVEDLSRMTRPSSSDDADEADDPSNANPSVSLGTNKMRIKLKMPKMGATSGQPHRRLPMMTKNNRVAVGNATQRSEKSLPIATKALPMATKSLPMASKKSQSNKKTSLGRMLPLAGGPRKLPVAADNSNSNNNSSSSPGSATGAGDSSAATNNKPKASRIRSFKLPLSKKSFHSDDEEEEEDAPVAMVVSSVGGGSTTTTKSARARRTTISTKVRIPPLLSPGLLVTPSAAAAAASSTNAKQPPMSLPEVKPGSQCLTPADIFDHSMAAAGYTVEAREKRPHRGSSTTREVGDMFDSNVKLTLHFPPLVPAELWNYKKEEDEEEQNKKESKDDTLRPNENGVKHHTKTKGDGKTLSQRVIEGLENARSKQSSDLPIPEKRGRIKRPRPWTYREMLPVPLTLPYPESYITDQLEYVQLVLEREKAIRRKQAQDEIAILLGGESLAPPVPVPTIPSLPTPPVMKDADFLQHNKPDEKNPHLYLPKVNPDFVSHLDKNCFHITQGRYCGLWSNRIADPNFVGASAPGVAGMSVAGGAGLAVASTGVTAAATAIYITSSFYKSALASTADFVPSLAVAVEEPPPTPPPLPEPIVTATEEPQAEPTTNNSSRSSPKPPVAEATEVKVMEEPKKPPPPLEMKSEKKKPSTKEAPVALKANAAAPVGSNAALKKVMDGGGPEAEAMRSAIIRAAVYASRTASHGKPFLACGKVYQDVSKAFAQHASVKPCLRCKNNKQGAYHCRLRRRHFDVDFDGGDTAKEIRLLFDVPIEELVQENDGKG